MADPTTYALLCSNIATWMIRDDLTSIIPEFVSSAEQRLNRVLRLPEMETITTLTTSGETIDLPADFLQARSAFLNTDPKVILEQMAPMDLRAKYSAAANGQPQNFALQSASEMVLGPSPDSTYNLVLNYYAKIPALSDDAPSNWLLASYPDVYRAAALVEGFVYIRDNDAMLRWQGILQQKVAELQSQSIKRANSASPQRIRSSVVV